MKDLTNRVEQLEAQVDGLIQIVAKYECDFMLPNEVAKLLDIKIGTVYRKVSNGTIPYYKDGKKLYFSKKAIINNLTKHN